MPPRRAAISFSFRPPIGKTRPRSVISPVIAMSLRTGMPVSTETIEVTIATPADGPSFGVAPSGHVDVDVALLEAASARYRKRRYAIDVALRGLHQFLHHVASLPVAVTRPLPGSSTDSIVRRRDAGW